MFTKKKQWSNALHTNSNFCRYQGFVANGDVGVLGNVAARTSGGREVVVVVDVSFARGISLAVVSLIVMMLAN